MYPSRELSRLGHYKTMLRRRITRHRTECAVAAARATQPLAWVDRMLVLWRRISPLAKFAAVPLALFWKRPAAPKPLGALLRWLPVVTGVIQGFKALRSR